MHFLLLTDSSLSDTSHPSPSISSPNTRTACTRTALSNISHVWKALIKLCNTDTAGVHFNDLSASHYTHTLPYVHAVILGRAEKAEKQTLSCRINRLEGKVENITVRSIMKSRCPTSLQCYIISRGTENWLMNDLEQQHIWQTLAKAFMYNFIRSGFTNLSSIYIFLSQDRWLSFEESCRRDCHAVSLRLNEEDS